MKIAIVKTSALGDIIHASFVPMLLKKHMPDIQIDWVVTQDLAEVLDDHPYIDNIIKLPYRSQALTWPTLKGLWQFAKKSHQNYDYIFDLQSLLKSALISFLLPGKTVGFTAQGCREKLASISYNSKHNIAYSDNIFKRNLYLFKEHFAIDLDKHKNTASTTKHLFYAESAYEQIQNFLIPNKKNILLIPGASTMKKVYSCARYAKLIDTTATKSHHFIIAWGNSKERKLALEIEKQCQHYKPLILPRRLEYNHLKALIDNVDLVIGSDTGPVHMAWALNTASIVLFATSNPASAERNHLNTSINKAISATSMHTISTKAILTQMQNILPS